MNLRTVRVITYSLKPDSSHSDEYHRTISDFATYWITATVPDLRDLVDGFRQYRLEQGMADRSDAEYAFELLALGVPLREHGGEAVRMRGRVRRWMSRLIDLQNRQPRWEKQVKALRGWLGWIARRFPSMEGEDDRIELLIDWLAAGVDPTQATLFIQSRVPEHAELFLLLSMGTPLGWLERVPSCRDLLYFPAEDP